MASYESVQLEEEARQKRQQQVHEEGAFQIVYDCNRKISSIGLEKSNPTRSLLEK